MHAMLICYVLTVLTIHHTRKKASAYPRKHVLIQVCFAPWVQVLNCKFCDSWLRFIIWILRRSDMTDDGSQDLPESDFMKAFKVASFETGTAEDKEQTGTDNKNFWQNLLSDSVAQEEQAELQRLGKGMRERRQVRHILLAIDKGYNKSKNRDKIIPCLMRVFSKSWHYTANFDVEACVHIKLTSQVMLAKFMWRYRMRGIMAWLKPSYYDCL